MVLCISVHGSLAWVMVVLYDALCRKKGLYGEGMPEYEGMVVTVKTHGHTTGKGAHEPRPKQVASLSSSSNLTDGRMKDKGQSCV